MNIEKFTEGAESVMEMWESLGCTKEILMQHQRDLYQMITESSDTGEASRKVEAWLIEDKSPEIRIIRLRMLSLGWANALRYIKSVHEEEIQAVKEVLDSLAKRD